MLAGQQRRAEWFCKAWGSSGVAFLGGHPSQTAKVNSSTLETGLSELSRGLLSTPSPALHFPNVKIGAQRGQKLT